MLTKKQLVAETQGELNTNVAGWVARNVVLLKGKFAKRYPRSRNLFNIQVLNTNGSKRIMVLKEGNSVTFTKNPYKNVIPFTTLRKLGCPTA